MIALALLLSLASSAHAQAPLRLDTLDCTALNGGTTETTESRGDVAVIDARLGFANATYYGKLATLSGHDARFELRDESARLALVVTASVDPSNRGPQTVDALFQLANAPQASVAARCQIIVTDLD